MYVRIGKKGWIRGIQVIGRAERCMSRQIEKGWNKGVQVIGWR